MNLATRYQKYEEEFLKAMATRFSLTGKNYLIFIARFEEKNADSSNQAIAECYTTELLEHTKYQESEDEGIRKKESNRIFNQQLSAICKTLEKAGCNFNGDKKGRWILAKKWLREEVFPQWLQENHLVTREQVWQHFSKKADRRSENIELEVVGDTHLGLIHKESRWDVPFKSNLRFKLNLDSMGHLILLEKAPSGEICCVCPSTYAPKSQFTENAQIMLPQSPPSPYPCFTANERGKEEILAIFTPKKPPFDWLDKNRQKFIQFEKGHLVALWQYVQAESESQMFYLEYWVS